MLQLTRARNRLTTPATLTLPEIAASGLTVSTLSQPLLQERDFPLRSLACPWEGHGYDGVLETPNCCQSEFLGLCSSLG